MSITAQSPADWLLEVNNLSCGYGGDSVVKDLGARYRRKNGESAWCFRITRCFHT